MTDSCEALVIGAGIVGTACALELARAGLSVRVLERAEVGGGATAAGMGHIVVLDDSPAQFALTRHSQQLWDQMVRDDPLPHEFTRCGTIWIAADDAEMSEALRKQQYYQVNNVPARYLNVDELYALEPNLKPGFAGGMLAPDDGVVYAPRSAALMMQQAVLLGARMQRGTVARLRDHGVVLADGTAIQSDAVIVANGLHALELAPDLPLRAKKGHLAITERHPGLVHHQLVELGYVTSAHTASGDSAASMSNPVRPVSCWWVPRGSSTPCTRRSTIRCFRACCAELWSICRGSGRYHAYACGREREPPRRMDCR